MWNLVSQFEVFGVVHEPRKNKTLVETWRFCSIVECMWAGARARARERHSLVVLCMLAVGLNSSFSFSLIYCSSRRCYTTSFYFHHSLRLLFVSPLSRRATWREPPCHTFLLYSSLSSVSWCVVASLEIRRQLMPTSIESSVLKTRHTKNNDKRRTIQLYEDPHTTNLVFLNLDDKYCC